MDYNELREKYRVFDYLGYTVSEKDDKLYVKYEFETEGLAEFKPEWTFMKSRNVSINNSVLQSLIFSLGMVELISYWKVSCPPTVRVKCGKLDDFQIQWWKKQYFNGLGEFFHINNIDADIDGFMTIESEGEITADKGDMITEGGVLIPIGGGKDSAVSIELLKDMPKKGGYIINPRGAATETAEKAGLENIIIADRTLDRNMLELNKQGYLNGHTPFSAIVAFSAVIEAYLNGYKYIALSNEASANESTVMGSSVNHQYSKSFEFEKDFKEYEEKYIKSGISYFSLLRVWSEYQIAEYFAKQKKYHRVFKSCNKGSKQNIWCCGCSKCLFVYIILSPFLTEEELVNIFGENLADKKELKEDFEKLIGYLPEKPFECVGSRDEVNTAVCETIKKTDKLPYLFEYYKTLPFYEEYKDRENPYTDYFNKENLIPPDIIKVFEKEV